MRQTRLQSLGEALANLVAGWMLALATQLLVFPVLGLEATLQQNLALSGVFTAVSLIRSYLLRRLFDNRMTARCPASPSN